MTRMAESGAAASKPRRRRTQQERRAATRAALLDATIECLVEYGYAGVTTTKIVEHAGVSRGAQVHHFPTKAQLVADLLWEAHSGPLGQAALELWVAARTDEELREHLHAVERNVSGAVRSTAVELFGDYGKGPSFRANLEVAMSTMRGLTLLRGSNGRSVERRWTVSL